MTLREVTYYIATCDFPGCDAEAEYGDYTAMGYASEAIEMAVDADWMTSPDEERIYCPAHPKVWESDLNEDGTAALTKPYLLLKDDEFDRVVLIADVREAADEIYGDDRAAGPYSHPLSGASWLRHRADRIERGAS